MMKDTKKEKKPSLSVHQKIRKAAFVQIKTDETERFKYLLVHNSLKKIKIKLMDYKRMLNSIIQRPKLWTSEVDWQRLRNDVFGEIINITIEGATANFATHYLFGLPFNPGTILAHGIIIRQGINIFLRLKNNGASTAIPKKD